MENEIRTIKGFKKTEVGVIPNDWEVKTLGELTKLKNGYAFSSEFFSNSGPIVITPGNFKLSGGLIFNDRNTLRYSGVVSKEMQFQNGDLLIVMTDLTPGCNLLGKPGIVKSEEIILHNQRIGKITIINQQLEQGYLYWFLVSELFSKRMKETATGSTVRHTSVGSINNTLFAIPTKAEQTAIATALNDADALITQLEKLIAKKKAMKQGAMQELLKPKEGWDWTTVGKLGKPYGGLSGKSKNDFNAGNCPYIPFMNVMSNPIIDKSFLRYVKIGSSENQNKAMKGDLFFNGSSETPEELGMCSVLLEDIPNLHLNSFCFGFRLNKELGTDGLYLAYYFRSSFGRRIFTILAQGATRHNLSKANFNKIEFQLPKPVDQKRISKIIQDMDNEILKLEDKLEKQKQLKQGMMQSLLTGKIRLV